ncbi:MAG: hypothetical protein ACRYFS_03010 [Janthinobacterium lividum]
MALSGGCSKYFYVIGEHSLGRIGFVQGSHGLHFFGHSRPQPTCVIFDGLTLQSTPDTK